ncbi:unnamed protein product [Diatraea saccharalis]|uniref:Beta-glucosidase n=1 Tax=Diatraea saccharalis TaxID=40085 RepID=A0A9N9QY90_9NEOP|nr:unnamed protein product [Diatraea saccharalis]
MVEGSPELKAVFQYHPDWKATGSRVLWIYPEGLRRSLVWLKKQYGDVEIVVTENGYSSKINNREDTDRINFIKTYLEQLLLAIKEDGVNVTGYTVWSLMDNFEWGEGYGSMFGLYSVDFNNPSRPRTARQSALYYANVIKAHNLDVTTSSTTNSSETN